MIYYQEKHTSECTLSKFRVSRIKLRIYYKLPLLHVKMLLNVRINCNDNDLLYTFVNIKYYKVSINMYIISI